MSESWRGYLSQPMKPLTSHRGICAPIPFDNVDTDQIIPSREMGQVSRKGLGDGLFAGWRYLYEGRERIGPNPEFVLNQTQFSGATILLGGHNFGCGSSREHAVWALRDFGIRVIIASSFGRIFRRNCARNNLLAIELPEDQIEQIRQLTEANPQANQIQVDLRTNRIVVSDQTSIEFAIDAFDREMLLKGLDYIDFTLQYADQIEAFIERDKEVRGWAYL